jgi:hypothetical protein
MIYYIISFCISYYDILYLNIHWLRRVKSLNPIVSHVVPVAQAAQPRLPLATATTPRKSCGHSVILPCHVTTEADLF